MEETEAAPAPAPASRTEEAPAPTFFSLSDRIGRLRYFVYSLAGMLVASASLLLIYLFCLVLPPELARPVYAISAILITKILMPMIVFVMTVRRLHDFDFVGWWALLVLIPFLTVPLLFVPGNAGVNRFGPPPRDNGPAVKLAAILMPLAMFLLFLSLKDSPPHAPPPPTGGLQSYPQ